MARIVELPRANHLSVVDSRELIGDNLPPKVDPETGLPETLQAYVVSKDPKITVLPNFFSEAECDHLADLVSGTGDGPGCWMPSLVGGAAYVQGKQENLGDQGSVSNTVSQTRTSWSCMLRYAQTSIVERLEHRVASVAGLPGGVAQMERFNMVRYAPGETFREHHDGKFRPKTVFVYLNDLDEDDDGGDTFFPIVGFSFKPRRGTAVMWGNASEDGQKEDSRMVHAGRPPFKCIKYGVNCFTNENSQRELVHPTQRISLQDAAVQRVADLAEGPSVGDDGQPVLKIYEVSANPKIVAVPGLLNAAEVAHMLEYADGKELQPSGPFQRGTQCLAQLAFACSPVVEAVEARLMAVSGEHLDNLAQLRIVRPGMEEGLCNRGCGKHSVYVCLSSQDEVFFPSLGIRFLLGPGDALSIHNVNFDTGFCRDDLRTVRVHRCEDGATPAVGLDAYFHDNPLREQQKVRNFVSYSDIRPEAA